MGADAPTELYRKLIEAVYRKFNNDKIADISRIMEKYEGQEAEIYDKVVRKYVFSQEEAVWRPLLVAMYKRFNPTKLPDLGMILLKYKDSEAALFKALCDKYIPDTKKSDELPVLNVWDNTGVAGEQPDVTALLSNAQAQQAAAADPGLDGDKVASVSQPAAPSRTEAVSPAAGIDSSRGAGERGERDGGRRKRQYAEEARDAASVNADQQGQPAGTSTVGSSRERRHRRAAENGVNGVNGQSNSLQAPEIRASAPASTPEVSSAAQEDTRTAERLSSPGADRQAPLSETPQPEGARDRPRRRAAKAAAAQSALAASANDASAQAVGEVGEAERPRRRHRHACNALHPAGHQQTDTAAPNEHPTETQLPPATRAKAAPRRLLANDSPGQSAEAVAKAPGADMVVAAPAPDYAVPPPAAAAVARVKRRKKLPPPPDPMQAHQASPQFAAAPEESKVADPSPPPSLAEGAAEEPDGLAKREAFLRNLLLKAKAKVQVPATGAAPTLSQPTIAVGMRPSKGKRAAPAAGAEHAKVAAAEPVRTVHLAPNTEAESVKPRAHKDRHRTADRVRRRGNAADLEPVGADPVSHMDPVDEDVNLAEDEGMKKVVLRSHKDVLRDKGLDSESVFHWRADS